MEKRKLNKDLNRKREYYIQTWFIHWIRRLHLSTNGWVRVWRNIIPLTVWVPKSFSKFAINTTTLCCWSIIAAINNYCEAVAKAKSAQLKDIKKTLIDNLKIKTWERIA